MKLQRVHRYPVIQVALSLTMMFLILGLVSLIWTPVSPTKIAIMRRLRPPLEQGFLGTDQLGRDVLSMLMAGAWNSLSTSLVSVFFGASLGTAIGLLVASRRGLLEAVVMRSCDVIFAVPPILSAMMLAAFIGASRFTAVIAIATFMVPVFVRLSLASASQIWKRSYVVAAIGMGRSSAKITMVHILPNILNQIIVQITIQLGLAILTEAGLSYLGLGMAPPAPTWGRMLADAQTYFMQAPWLALMPGLAIMLAVLGFNLLGDGLRDLLDPRSS